MNDWRSLAAKGDWHKISPYDLTDEEQDELFGIVSTSVPIVEAGNGVETFSRYLAPRDAESLEQYEAAYLVERLQRYRRPIPRQHNPFFEAVNHAVRQVELSGFHYEGWHGTYLYRGDAPNEWYQIRTDIGRRIDMKRHAFEQQLWLGEGPCRAIATRRFVDWKNLYPWRASLTLNELFKIDSFEEMTPFWHALNILNWYDSFRENLPVPVGRWEKVWAANGIAMAGLEIGRSFEALQKKRFEPHAIVGMKNLAGRRFGAATRRGQTKPNTMAVLAEMKRLVSEGHSVSRAAAICAERKVGTSTEANRKMWNRARK